MTHIVHPTRRGAIGMRPLLLAVTLVLATPAAAQQLVAMTFNVRYAEPKDGANRWEARRAIAAAAIRRARADVVGTQELLQRQGDDLVAALPGYRWFGRDRRGGHRDEHMGILYRTASLRLIERGDFWLSDTPDAVGSVAWGADLPRMAAWAVFETRGRTRRRFVFLDTHFAHRDIDDLARTRSARLILARLPAIAHGLPVIVAGDLNATPDSDAYAALARELTDVRAAAPRRAGPEATYHGFTGLARTRIDYLFERGFRPVAVSTSTDHVGAVYASDHFPVVATLRFAGR